MINVLPPRCRFDNCKSFFLDVLAEKEGACYSNVKHSSYPGAPNVDNTPVTKLAT